MAKQDVTSQSESQTKDAAQGAVDNASTDGVDVVYRLERIAYELLEDLHDKGIVSFSGRTYEKSEDDGSRITGPSTLVMMQGKPVKQFHSDLANAGFTSVMPLTGDWRLDSNPKFAYRTVSLGVKPTQASFSNAHAVLKAAEEGRVLSIFLTGDSVALAQDNRFLQRAADMGIRVFKPLDIDQTLQSWVECLPNEDAEQPSRWRTCHSCKLTFDNDEFVAAGYKCPSCGTLARLTSDERIEMIVDPGSFEEWDADLEDVDPLEFPGYTDKIDSYRERTGKHEAIVTGRATLGGLPTAIGFMESAFLMGSMGTIVGEKVSRLFDRATDEELPVIIFCASGGARMQEGLASLMQMAKTSCAVERHDRAGLLYISVLTDPTTGGVTASFAMLGDMILAEPGALIGFAGQRVIRDTIKQDLPEGFQTAEFALEHGLIDAIVEREELRDVLKAGIAFHQKHPEDGQGAFFKSFGETKDQAEDDASFPVKWISSQLERIPFVERFKRSPEENKNRRELERHAMREIKRSGISTDADPGSAWESVQIARNVHRPTASSYIRVLSPSFLELHGDREFADDKAIVAGLGRIDGRPVTIIAQEKGATLADRIERNFGCPQPEGYRKTARLMKQAEKFNRPIVCLVDTQGAFCGTEAEERGQGNAIAENLELMAGLRVPVVSVLLGEGGSGGALALAVANKVAMQKHAVYSVLSPEGFASILWKDGKRAPEAAEIMGMNAEEVLRLGVVDDVLSEGRKAAHENPEEAAQIVHDYVAQALDELCELTPDEVLEQRQERFAKF